MAKKSEKPTHVVKATEKTFLGAVVRWRNRPSRKLHRPSASTINAPGRIPAMNNRSTLTSATMP